MAEPGTPEFDPDKHFGEHPEAQAIYDTEVEGALAEVLAQADASLQVIALLINNRAIYN